MRHVVVCALVALLSLPVLADDVTLRDVPHTDGSWQEARGLVDAPPDVVRRWVTDYRRWPEWFSDVKSVEILSSTAQRTTLRFHSRIFDRKMTIHLVPTSDGIAYRGDDGSITTEGKIWLSDAGSGRTDVTIQNFAHVGGFLGAFVPRSTIRDRQRSKLRADLLDLQRTARRFYVAR